MDSPSPQRGRSRPSTNDKEAYGLNLGMLRKWHREKKDEMLSSEQAKQEIAVSKVRGFLDAVGKFFRMHFHLCPRYSAIHIANPCHLLNISVSYLLFPLIHRLCGAHSVVVAHDEAVPRLPGPEASAEGNQGRLLQSPAAVLEVRAPVQGTLNVCFHFCRCFTSITLLLHLSVQFYSEPCAFVFVS